MFPIQDSVPSRCSGGYAGVDAVVFFFELGLSQHALDQVFYLFDMDARLSDHFDRARELGLPVRNEMPENVLHLMQLYPQPTRRQPSVEYLPVRNPPRRAGSQAGN